MFLAIDFDGTIVEHEFPDIGAAAPGVFSWLKEFQAAGAKLILWTMRSDGRTGEGKECGPVLTQAVEFCREHGLEFYAVNENPTQQSWTNSPKVYAHRYIDDAATGWSIIGPLVLEEIKAHFAAKKALT